LVGIDRFPSNNHSRQPDSCRPKLFERFDAVLFGWIIDDDDRAT
jgi:hypothetical protein